jgi:hypothetical protein
MSPSALSGCPNAIPLHGGMKLSKGQALCRCSGKNVMRYVAWLPVLLPLAACGSVGAGQSATLILNNPTWDRVNVEAVITTSPNCDNRDAYVSTQDFVMTKNRTQRIEAPKAENICWRHDSNPNNPIAGVWSGWSRATMFPGQTYETEL